MTGTERRAGEWKLRWYYTMAVDVFEGRAEAGEADSASGRGRRRMREEHTKGSG